MSQYGKLKHIVDLETVLGWRLSNIDFTSITDKTITYGWGDESELINRIHNKDSNMQFGGNFVTVSGSTTTVVNTPIKYPLIWLVTPVRSVNENDIKRFDNVRLIICTNTEEEWLNSTRWKKYIPMLQAITDNIIDKLRGNIRITRDDGVLQYDYRNVPKYSVGETGGKNAKSKAMDIWDAVVLTTDLIIDDSCMNDSYYEFCNK